MNGIKLAKIERKKWKDIEVGDLAIVRDGEDIPADLVVLSTSYQDAKAYI